MGGGSEGGALLKHRASRPVRGPLQARALVVVWRKASRRSRGPRRPEFHKTGRAGSAHRPRPARAERLASSSWRPRSWEHRCAPAPSLRGTVFACGVPSRCLGRLVRCWLQFRVLFCCVCGASRVWEKLRWARSAFPRRVLCGPFPTRQDTRGSPTCPKTPSGQKEHQLCLLLPAREQTNGPPSYLQVGLRSERPSEGARAGGRHVAVRDWPREPVQFCLRNFWAFFYFFSQFPLIFICAWEAVVWR